MTKATPASRLSTKTVTVVLGGRCTATVNSATSIAPATNSENAESATSTRASPTGRRRRSHRRGAAQHADDLVEVEQPLRSGQGGRVEALGSRQNPEGRREQKQAGVHEPIAETVPGGRGSVHLPGAYGAAGRYRPR